MVKYFDKQCKEITEAKWRELKMDKAYCTVGEFSNERFHLLVGWTGKIENTENLFRTSYPLFDTLLMQYDEDQESWTLAPDSGKTFSKESKARDYYETFLMKFTDAYVDEDGILVEEGNLSEAVEPKKPVEKEPEKFDAPMGEYDAMVW